MVSLPPAPPMDADDDAPPPRANEARYQSLFESLDEGFCVIDLLFDEQGRPTDYRFLEANAAYHRHTGQLAVVGQTARALFTHVEQAWLASFALALRTGRPQRLRHHLQPCNRWFDVCAVRDGPPGSTRLSLLAIEATARVLADQQQQALAQRLAASDRRKSEFLATLAHELRNPLAPLRNGVHVLRISHEAAVRQRALAMLERQLTHITRLVDDLLDMARVGAGKITLRRQHLDLRQVVHDAIESCRPLIDEAGHRLHLALPLQPVWIVGDPTRLTQVLCNLLNNASKYTPGPGHLALTLTVEGESACVSVSDDGLGMPAESLPRVFDMFEQLDTPDGQGRGGLGIGLALVRAFTEMHGGQVRADSPGPDQGSTFTVTLPLALAFGPPAPADSLSAGPTAREAPLPLTAATPGELSILVVDDNADAAESLALILQMNGHVARVAHDGASALTLAAQMQPDAVFLDIGLPGMSGYAVARALRGLTRGKRLAPLLVALTGWGSEEDRTRALEAGFDHHLTKPADIAAVERLLAGLHAPV